MILRGERSRQVTIVGLACVAEERVLLVRKRSLPAWILPGGKPEAGEDDHAALAREIAEELGCRLDRSSLRFIGTFEDVSADSPEITVVVQLYAGDLIGQPVVSAELEALTWFRPGEEAGFPLAPSIQNQILAVIFPG